jgi:hypothetical protein
MKKVVFLFLLPGLLCLFSISMAQTDVSLTAAEILEKSIKFHDPEGKWNQFSGKLKLNVCFQNTGNTYGTEIIEIDVARDFYQWTRLINGFKVVKGIEDGRIFYSVNGNSNPSPEERKAFSINENNISMMKEHHYWHFGKFNHLKNIGATLQPQVTKAVFIDKPCYQLTFTGENLKVNHPYFKQKNIFWIDPVTFAIVGWIYDTGYGRMEGTININGLKVPAVETWYSKENNNLQGVTLFSRGNDENNLPPEFRSVSQPTASNTGYVSTHLLKLENDEILKTLDEPLKEINDTLAGMGYPECGYVVYKVTADQKSDYTHILEGWWLSREVYDETHKHPAFIEVFTKYQKLFETVLADQTYFRSEKILPVF